VGPSVLPGSYRVQIVVNDQVVHEAPLTVTRDPLVTLTDAEYRSLHDARVQAYGIQRDARAAAQPLEEARSRLAAARANADTTRGPGQAARALEREIEAELARLCGARGFAQCGPGGGGGFGGGFGGGNAQPGAFQQATSVANTIGSSHFLPTPGHREDLAAAARTVAEARPRAQALLGRVEAVARGVGGR
jgi:hypothetical protein